MQDMRAHLEKLRIEADECELINKLAQRDQERAVRQAGTHYRRCARPLADEVERAMSDVRSSP